MVLHEDNMTMKVLLKEPGVDRNSPRQKSLREKFMEIDDKSKYNEHF